MNIRDKKAQAIPTTVTQWQEISVGDWLLIHHEGYPGKMTKAQVTAIALDDKGNYPMITLDVPAYGWVQRRADDCWYEASVTLFMEVSAVAMLAETASDLADSEAARYVGTVADWDTARENMPPR